MPTPPGAGACAGLSSRLGESIRLFLSLSAAAEEPVRERLTPTPTPTEEAVEQSRAPAPVVEDDMDVDVEDADAVPEEDGDVKLDVEVWFRALDMGYCSATFTQKTALSLWSTLSSICS